MEYIYTKNPKHRPIGTYLLDSSITFRINDSIKLLLRECCEENKLSMSAGIMMALENWKPIQELALKKARALGYPDDILVDMGIFEKSVVELFPPAES
jgi:hypothetical protein